MPDTPAPKKTATRGRRTPKPATPERLHRAALHYLERYASSTDNLRRVLQRRTDRSARLHGTDRDEAAGWIDAIVGRLTAAGLLDDRAYAETRAASLQRHGASRRKIAGMLQQKGVDADTVAAALEALERDLPSPDLDAAIRFARRRRLGPWRPDEKREERRERDLAALARAGFSYSLAHRIVDADSVEALEDALFEQ